MWGEDVRDDKLAADSSVVHCRVTAVHSPALGSALLLCTELKKKTAV